jgi:peptidoglycan/xylan/chitin deacetylase (PgdA/CDA1 family)
MSTGERFSRRRFLEATGAAGAGLALNGAIEAAGAAPAGKALIAITLDLEMARNFPRWEDTHWDYEKGSLTDEVKRFAVEAARRVKARGGRIHFFLVGRALEQADVGWAQELVREGHPVGNHTYDHVNVLATQADQIQFRFQRSPWLIAGRTPAEVIRENIRLCTGAMQDRLQRAPDGFRTPGGFATGLEGRDDVQRMLMELGFRWVSSRYPRHLPAGAGKEPDRAFLESVLAAQESAQPHVYPTGLVEVPMSPVSDVGAFRTGRWKLDWFLRVTREAVTWAIEHGRCFDFLAHPSVLGVVDPEFRTLDLICDLVARAGNRAALVDLNRMAARAARP